MKKLSVLLSATVLLSFSVAGQYHVNLTVLDTVPAYTTGNASTFVEYNEMMACVDSLGKITILSIENYSLKLYESSDSGQTWTKSSLTTGEEGDFWTAMITCTPGGQRVIIYGSNPNQNYGQNLDPYSTYFTYSTYGYVETPGGWQKTTLSTAGYNTGLIPFAIHRAKNGLIHAFLHQRGWNTYGGYIHTSVFNPATSQWSATQLIYGYSQTIDRLTTGYAKVVEDSLGNIGLVYRKQSSSGTGNIYELALLRQSGGSWTGVTPVVLSADYPISYWTYDAAVDDAGNFFFTRLSNSGYGPNGPGLVMCKNQFTGDTIFPFTAADTLQAVALLERPGPAGPFLALYFKYAGKKFYEYDGSTGTLSPKTQPFFQDMLDSAQFYSYPWNPWVIKRNSNFSANSDIYLVQKEGKGRDPVNTSIVLPQPFKFTRFYIPLSTEAKILRFTIPNMIASLIDTVNNTVLVVMPAGTNLSSLAPDTIKLSEYAMVSPGVGVAQNFSSSSVTYTVTAQDNNYQIAWEVSVVDNTGLDEHTEPIIRAFPNPATDLIEVMLDGPAYLQLMDLNGRRLFGTYCTSNCTLDVSSLPTGIYCLTASSEQTFTSSLISVRR